MGADIEPEHKLKCPYCGEEFTSTRKWTQIPMHIMQPVPGYLAVCKGVYEKIESEVAK